MLSEIEPRTRLEVCGFVPFTDDDAAQRREAVQALSQGVGVRRDGSHLHGRRELIGASYEEATIEPERFTSNTPAFIGTWSLQYQQGRSDRYIGRFLAMGVYLLAVRRKPSFAGGLEVDHHIFVVLVVRNRVYFWQDIDPVTGGLEHRQQQILKRKSVEIPSSLSRVFCAANIELD